MTFVSSYSRPHQFHQQNSNDRLHRSHQTCASCRRISHSVALNGEQLLTISTRTSGQKRSSFFLPDGKGNPWAAHSNAYHDIMGTQAHDDDDDDDGALVIETDKYSPRTFALNLGKTENLLSTRDTHHYARLRCARNAR